MGSHKGGIQLSDAAGSGPREMAMTGTTAKAHLYDRLIEPLKDCQGLNIYRHSLMTRVMSMPDVEVRERLRHLEKLQSLNSE